MLMLSVASMQHWFESIRGIFKYKSRNLIHVSPFLIFIDDFRCPVDNYVFPGLDRSRSGDGLEARFNAFKIPESNFLVFEATVRTCRDGCQPV